MPLRKQKAYSATEQKKVRIRCVLVGCSFFLALAVVALKAVYVQLYQGPWLYRQAWEQLESSYRSIGRRGTIYDRNHHKLAVSLKVPSIVANPQKVENLQDFHW